MLKYVARIDLFTIQNLMLY